MADTPEIRLVREMYEASNRGDFDRAREFFHPDVELIVSDALPDSGIYRGREALFGWFGNWYTTLFESFQVEIKGMTQYGQAVVIDHRLHGTGRASGVDVTLDNASVNTVRGGLIVRVQLQSSLEEAIRMAEAEAGEAA